MVLPLKHAGCFLFDWFYLTIFYQDCVNAEAGQAFFSLNTFFLFTCLWEPGKR